MVLLMVMAGASCYCPTQISWPLLSFCGIYTLIDNTFWFEEATRQEAVVASGDAGCRQQPLRLAALSEGYKIALILRSMDRLFQGRHAVDVIPDVL
jgi:hypothetical protein